MNVTKSGIVKSNSSSIHTIINNPCATGTSTNWTFGGAVSISSGIVQLTGVNPAIRSSSFELGANDIIVFEFGVSLPTPSSTGNGLYLGTTYNVSTKRYHYNNGWVYDGTDNNPYFLYAYNSSTVNRIKTYIIGPSVDINTVPRTEQSTNSHIIYVCQPTTGTTTTIRDGYNSNPSMVINLYDLKLYKLNYCGICENDGEASFGKGYLSFDDYIEI